MCGAPYNSGFSVVHVLSCLRAASLDFDFLACRCMSPKATVQATLLSLAAAKTQLVDPSNVSALNAGEMLRKPALDSSLLSSQFRSGHRCIDGCTCHHSHCPYFRFCNTILRQAPDCLSRSVIDCLPRSVIGASSRQKRGRVGNCPSYFPSKYHVPRQLWLI